MFTMLQEHVMGGKHYVDGGNVCCPMTQVVTDYERCFECSAFRRIAEDGRGEFVQCLPYVAPPLGFEVR